MDFNFTKVEKGVWQGASQEESTLKLNKSNLSIAGNLVSDFQTTSNTPSGEKVFWISLYIDKDNKAIQLEVSNPQEGYAFAQKLNTPNGALIGGVTKRLKDLPRGTYYSVEGQALVFQYRGEV